MPPLRKHKNGGVSHVCERHSKRFRVYNETNLFVASAIAGRIRPERRFTMGRPDPFLRDFAHNRGHLHYLYIERLGTGGALA